MPPDPPNLPIYSVFLALDANGPLQCECLDPPVITRDKSKKNGGSWMSTALSAMNFLFIN